MEDAWTLIHPYIRKSTFAKYQFTTFNCITSKLKIKTMKSVFDRIKQKKQENKAYQYKYYYYYAAACWVVCMWMDS